MFFQINVFFPLPLKKIFFPYLLGLGRKGQKPRICKKYGFLFPNKKRICSGDSQKFLIILSYLWKHDSQSGESSRKPPMGPEPLPCNDFSFLRE